MSFYLKPPRGETNLHILLECVQQRINCFYNLQNNIDIRDNEEFEYLLEDSILDRTSHFIFRLGVLRKIVSERIFIENELKLLNERLNCYDKGDFEYFLKNIIRQLKDCIRLDIGKQLSDFYWTLFYAISKMLRKGYLSHVYEVHTKADSQDLSCNTGCGIQVPFWYCNKLIASRTIYLKNGNAVFYCYQWREIVPALFESYLKIILSEMNHSRNVTNTLSDYRIIGCLEILKRYYSRKDEPSSGTTCLADLEDESSYFPLCMKNLYDSLKLNHRLAHNERFDLSLFLKDIGLTLDDSIKFWQAEYAKQHSSCSKCIHSWQANERKYIYGIRHLYGLEGSRKNYSVKSCKNLQESDLRIDSEGGCPFEHYDDDCLRSVLKKNLPGCDDDIEVMIFERRENASLSCKLYSECALKILKYDSLSDDMVVENPLQYYNQMKNIHKSELR